MCTLLVTQGGLGKEKGREPAEEGGSALSTGSPNPIRVEGRTMAQDVATGTEQPWFPDATIFLSKRP